MLVLNLPFKALMFLTLMRPSLVLFLVLWLKLVKDFLKVRCRLALLVSDKLLDLVGLGGKSAADKGKDTRDYLAAAFPELNAWERAGADASSAGMVDAGFENQKELTK